VLKEFKEGLRGMGIGEMKDIEIKYPDNYSDKQFAGNEIKYTAIIKEVKEIKLPELNDEFAKNFAQLESFDKLKGEIRTSLENQADSEAESTLKSDMIKQIIENNRFEVPNSMVEKYLQSVTEDFKKRYKDVDELKLRQSYRVIGEDTIRWQFIMREIADKENIKVSQDDRADWVKRFAGIYNMTEQSAREALGKAGKFDDIDDRLLEKKVLDFVKEKSKITS
jgi:trigger factor